MIKTINTFIKDEYGAATLDYALAMLLSISIIIIVASNTQTKISLINSSLTTKFNTVVNIMS